MAIELKIPSAGESIKEVQIATWSHVEGDYVSDGDVLVEIETDKASMDLPAPATGRITKVLKQAGETANVGDVIAIIDETADAPVDAAKPVPAKAAPASTAPTTQTPPKSDDGDGHIMPAARRVMAEHDLSRADVQATGPGGRILKEDAQRAADAAPATSAAREKSPAPASQVRTADGEREEQVVPMSMLRRRIAERLVDAQMNAAILTTFNEIDMSAVMKLREQRQDDFVKQHGIKLGFMSLFVKAAIDALRRVPAVNAEIRGTDLIYKNYYDIGVAVSTEKGLLVPVIRNAELLSFAEIEKTITDLAQRARDRKITVDELQGGTFTISNGGVFGSLLSTPILNPPQSGILGLHTIQDRPVAINGAVEVRPMMYVALSYDHRVIDGKESVTFLKRIKECVEDPTRMLIET